MKVGVYINMEFSNADELKKRLIPALNLRKRELKKQGIVITEEELWKYFVINYWKKASNLSLYEMVNDILNKEINKQEEVL